MSLTALAQIFQKIVGDTTAQRDARLPSKSRTLICNGQHRAFFGTGACYNPVKQQNQH